MNNLTHLIASPWLMHERMATVLYAQYMTGRLTITDHQIKALLKDGKPVLAGFSATKDIVGLVVPHTTARGMAFDAIDLTELSAKLGILKEKIVTYLLAKCCWTKTSLKVWLCMMMCTKAG